MTVKDGENTLIYMDCRCACSRCDTPGRQGVYRMVGSCSNCRSGEFLMLYRFGDEAAPRDCPRCGAWHSLGPHRAATDDEIPASCAS